MTNFKPWNAGTSKTKVKIICECCGIEVEKYLYGRDEVRFCSNKCAHEVMPNPTKGKFGRDHPKWKENKTRSLSCVIRHSQSYSEWRLMVYGRDGFICQKCGVKGVYLEAHHIIPLREIIKNNKLTYDNFNKCDQLWKIDNGITYCVNCHEKEDKMRNRFKKKEVIIMGGN